MKKNNPKNKYMDANPVVHMTDVILIAINSIQFTGKNFNLKP